MQNPGLELLATVSPLHQDSAWVRLFRLTIAMDFIQCSNHKNGLQAGTIAFSRGISSGGPARQRIEHPLLTYP